MPSRPGTLFSDDAHRVATRDREAAAALVLTAAVREAARLVRDGKPGQAEYVLARAEVSADRILGRGEGS